MKCSAEVRFLLVSVVLMVALVVPVAAATFGPDVDAAVVTDDVPSTASTTLVVEHAPPPLVFMALGTLLVVAMIGRRARRISITPLS